MARQNVERGFSVNKQVEIDNLSEEAFVAKRLICDHVTAVGVWQAELTFIHFFGYPK